MMGVLVALKAWAVANQQFGVDALLPEARRLLGEAQRDVASRIARNVLYHSTE
jgi:hypothetical protein